MESPIEYFIKHLLFVDEASLPGPVQDVTSYAADFESRGPKDSRGRSLRQLDLNRRLLKYPCSYLIYSDSFQKMHPTMRRHLLRRLHAILDDNSKDPEFKSLSRDSRRDIKQILTETLPDLPAFWGL